MTGQSDIKAVIFDIGGVVVGSPLVAINEYEQSRGLPHQYLNVAITAQGKEGSFQRFERNELDLLSFYHLFGKELSDTKVNNSHYVTYCRSRKLDVPALPDKLDVDGRELFGLMMQKSLTVDPLVANAIISLRASGRFKVAALTNNFAPPTESSLQAQGQTGADKARASPSLEEELEHLGLGSARKNIESMFDFFIQSSVVGMRKPDPNFYRYTLNLLQVKPSEVVFLDDIGINLKAAQAFGIKTIRVQPTSSIPALRELEKVTGIRLLPESSRKSNSSNL
ncbi:HAD-like protein [Violaceomyces palustris]|uniref:HAD-like protein n=1 Tax=Violaceomyces palustris TaxID=1673888 RepID=A0ACD0P5I9_9BASI|nr:HAD-like protein [Violaceomyces palustris]